MKHQIPQTTSKSSPPGTLHETLRKTVILTSTINDLRSTLLTMGGAKDKKVSSRISEDLLQTVKTRLGVTSDTEAIELALVNMAIIDDFGAWLVDQAGTLTQDFSLEL